MVTHEDATSESIQVWWYEQRVKYFRHCGCCEQFGWRSGVGGSQRVDLSRVAKYSTVYVQYQWLSDSLSFMLRALLVAFCRNRTWFAASIANTT